MTIDKSTNGFLIIELLIAISATIIMSLAACAAIALVAHWSSHAQLNMHALHAAQEIMYDQLHQAGRRSIAIDCTVSESMIKIPDLYSTNAFITLKHVTVTNQESHLKICSGVSKE